MNQLTPATYLADSISLLLHHARPKEMRPDFIFAAIMMHRPDLATLNAARQAFIERSAEVRDHMATSEGSDFHRVIGIESAENGLEDQALATAIIDRAIAVLHALDDRNAHGSVGDMLRHNVALTDVGCEE